MRLLCLKCAHNDACVHYVAHIRDWSDVLRKLRTRANYPVARLVCDIRGFQGVQKLQDSVVREIHNRWRRAAGGYLASLRRDRRLSQDEVATYLGLSRSQVSRLERGHVGVWFHDLPLYSRLYKMSVATIVAEIERWVLHTHR